MTPSGLGTTVSSSDLRGLTGSQAPYKKLSSRVVSRALRGRFNFQASGRNSCGSVNTNNSLKISETPGGGLFVHNEMHCNSISSCPRCRQRLLGQRGREIQALIDYWLAGIDLDFSDRFDRHALLLTLTFPHYSNDTLGGLLGSTRYCEGLRGARSYLFGQSKFAAITRGWLIPAVNGIEVTYGLNGPHPHIHCIIFVDAFKMPDKYRGDDGLLSVSKLKDLIFHYWRASCLKSGLPAPHPDFGCDLRQGANAGLYISKWSASDEVSDAHGSKDGHLYSKSIAQLEQAVVKKDEDISRFQANLSEYYNQMYGVRIHNFSRKLNNFRGIYANSQFQPVVSRVRGLGSGLSSRSYNEAGPAYLEDISKLPDFPISTFYPDFCDSSGDWALVESEIPTMTLLEQKQLWALEYVERLIFSNVGKKRASSKAGFAPAGIYGRGNRWYIPGYGPQPESNSDVSD